MGDDWPVSTLKIVTTDRKFRKGRVAREEPLVTTQHHGIDGAIQGIRGGVSTMGEEIIVGFVVRLEIGEELLVTPGNCMGKNHMDVSTNLAAISPNRRDSTNLGVSDKVS